MNELDSTCGVSDEELTERFKEAIRIDNEIKRIKGVPIAGYDASKKLAYLEYPDGRREYAAKGNREEYCFDVKEGNPMEKIQDVLLLFAQEVRKLMGEDLKKLLVYGSYARGDYNENSDVDIMILTSIAEDKIEQIEDVLYDKAFDFLMKYGIQISVIVKNEEQFNYWLGALPFYDNVNREGVEIIG